MPDIEGVPYEAAGTALDVATAQALAARNREAASAGVSAANAAADRSVAASDAAKAEATEAKALSQSVVAEVGTIRTAVVQSANSASAAAGSAAQAQQTADALVPRMEQIEAMAGLAPGEVTDAQTANLVSREDTETRAALNAASAEVVDARVSPLRKRVQGLDVHNRGKLTRWEAALADAGTTPAVLTFLGDSITEGVGSDGTSSGTSPDPWSIYRQAGYAVIVRKLLARDYGITPAENFIALAPQWGYATTEGDPARSQSLGPFGTYAGSWGGYNLSGNPAGQSITIPASKSGRFTTLDVLIWGPDSGVYQPATPTVTIDGEVKHTGVYRGATGNIHVVTITGLANTAHEITLTSPTSGSTVYPFAVVPRQDTGVIVNRIGASGATTANAVSTLTGAGRQRNIDSAVLRGYSDLTVIALGTNDHGHQIPIADYTANLQELINAAVGGGASVLLMGEPPSATATTRPIMEDEYRAAMRSLSDANDHVAYTDTRVLFGDRPTAYADGLFPTAGTVHPSRQGHLLMGQAIHDALPLARI